MEVSIFLAKVIGLYYVIVFVAVMVNRKNLPRLAEGFSENLALGYLAGFLAVVVGLLIVVSHNVWVADWRAIITVVGWLALLKGIVLMISPGSAGRHEKLLRSPVIFVLYGVVLVLGVYLTYVGFTSPLA